MMLNKRWITLTDAVFFLIALSMFITSIALLVLVVNIVITGVTL